MKRLITTLVLASVPVLLMVRGVQAYRYSIALEAIESYRVMQEESLEENKRLLAGIAVYSAPERIYSISNEYLRLESADQTKVVQVQLPKNQGRPGSD